MTGAALGGQGPILGRYAILDEIAAGGMATVHVARIVDPGRLQARGAAGEFVAVKRMHASYAKDQSFRSMFLDEGRLCTRIHHRNVVETLEVVEEAGELLLVMELVDGESLSRLAKIAASRGGRVPVPIVAAVVRDVLLGLHAAHEAVSEQGEPLQIVHRDVSPHNVLVGTDGFARVLDFGVAKARGRMQSTREGQIKGKLAYMSPEQARGKNVDRRSDLFATSIILWELLAGQRLFDGENEASILTQILTEKPPRLSEKRPELAAYDALLERGLSTRPEDRFASALAMAELIEEEFPLASPAEVAAYVAHEAADTLQRHAHLLARYRSSQTGPHPMAYLTDDQTTHFTPGGGRGAFLSEPSQPTNPFARPADSSRQSWAPPSSAHLRSPSDAPPMHSQVTSVSLTTTGLPPPLEQKRFKQLLWIGLATAGVVTVSLVALLVIVMKKPWNKDAGAADGSSETTQHADPPKKNLDSPKPTATTIPTAPSSLPVAGVPSAEASASAVPDPSSDPAASAKATTSAKPSGRFHKKTDYGF